MLIVEAHLRCSADGAPRLLLLNESFGGQREVEALGPTEVRIEPPIASARRIDYPRSCLTSCALRCCADRMFTLPHLHRDLALGMALPSDICTRTLFALSLALAEQVKLYWVGYHVPFTTVSIGAAQSDFHNEWLVRINAAFLAFKVRHAMAFTARIVTKRVRAWRQCG